MVDKNFCMSSYLAFRYIEKEDVNFYENIYHKNFIPVPEEKRVLVKTADEIGEEIEKSIKNLQNKKIGILLSGGMDSAIIASYMPGCDAYTFRFLGGDFGKEELERAEYYAREYGLNLHYVDINWEIVEKHLVKIMKGKAAPVHSIEPQIYEAAYQAKKQGIELILVGESSDLIFGGMDQLLSKDWKFEEFMNRYIFTNPDDVLKDANSMKYLFERYRQGDGIDFLKFMDEVFSIESSSSYLNAFEVAEMPYFDPYASLKMVDRLDLDRVRNGESKYLIRELFSKRYPNILIPEKIPMPRPVDIYFKNWEGPSRPEFKSNLDMSKFTGNQKWQMYCLEKFLNMYEPIGN